MGAACSRAPATRGDGDRAASGPISSPSPVTQGHHQATMIRRESPALSSNVEEPPRAVFPFVSGGIPKRLSSRGSTASERGRSKPSPGSPKFRQQAGFTLDLFNFEAAATTCTRNSDSLRPIAIGLVAGLPGRLQGVDAQKVSREILSSGHARDEIGQLLRQETALELLVPYAKKEVTYFDVQTAVSVLGPCQALVVLVQRSEPPALHYLLLKALGWLDDVSLSYYCKSIALLLLNKTLANFQEIADPPAETRDAVVNTVERGLFESDYSFSSYLDAFVAMVKRGWTKPEDVWRRMKDSNRSWDERAYRVLISALSAHVDQRNLSTELLTDSSFVDFVAHGLRIIKPRGTLTSKLAFELLHQVSSRLNDYCFSTFCSLYSLLDDPNVHLIVEPWRNVARLYERRTQAQQYSIASVNMHSAWRFNNEWCSILLARAFTCGNADVAKLALGKLLATSWSTDEHDSFPMWLIVEFLLPCLEMEELYMPSMYEAAGAFKIKPASFTTGKYKKNQEREESRVEIQGFDLPRGLLKFFEFQLSHISEQGDAVETWVRTILRGTKDLQNLSGAFTSVEAATAAALWRCKGRRSLEDETFTIMTQLVSKHALAGYTVRRALMLMGCILSFAIKTSPITDFRRVLRLCSTAPDFLLRHDAAAVIGRRSRKRVLETLGKYLSLDGGVERLIEAIKMDKNDSDARFADTWGLACAALQVSGSDLAWLVEFSPSIHQSETSERRWMLLTLMWVKLVGSDTFVSQTNKLVLVTFVDVAWTRLEQSLENATSEELLEEAWLGQGGAARASLTDKRESLSYLSLGFLSLLEGKVPSEDRRTRIVSRAIELFITPPTVVNLRALVVLSVALMEGPNSSKLSNDSNGTNHSDSPVALLATRILSLNSSNVEWAWPANRSLVTASTMLAEWEARRWQVLSLIYTNSGNLNIDNHLSEPLKKQIVKVATVELGSRDTSEQVVPWLVRIIAKHSSLEAGRGSEDLHDEWELLLNLTVSHKSAPSTGDAFFDIVFSDESMIKRPDHVRRVMHRMLDPNDTTTYEIAVKRMCGIVLHPTNGVWARDPARASGFEDEIIMMLTRNDKLSEALDYAAGLAARSVVVLREQIFICRQERTVHPCALVRFACLGWLDACLIRWNDLSIESQHFLRTMALRVLRELTEHKLVKTTFHEHLPKYLSKALLVMSRSFGREDCGPVSESLLKVTVSGAITADVKQNMEKVIVHLFVMEWQKVLPLIRAQITSNTNGWVVMALLSCVSVGWHRIIDEKPSKPRAEIVQLDAEILDVALPWLTCSKSSIRVLASNMCINVRARGLIKLDTPRMIALAPVLDYLAKNNQMKRLMDRVTLDQKNNSALDLKMDLLSLFESSEFNLLGDLCPRDLRMDRIADLVREEQAAFFANFADQGDSDEDEQGLSRQASGSDVALKPMFFQKKIDTSGNGVAMEGERGSARQSLVVVASSVDKIPNLAGLARTCEVFRARTLVLGDVSVLNDGEFKSISRTAENWLPIVEVKPANVTEYLLRLRRDEGFTLIGLEQTTSSIPLQDMEWPSHGRVCIVLGAEGTGVSADVLALLDATIEIPQFGMVKSLNVHVSGALCVWAYTEAMLAFGQS